MGRDLQSQKDYKYPHHAENVERAEASLVSENFAILNKGDVKYFPVEQVIIQFVNQLDVSTEHKVRASR